MPNGLNMFEPYPPKCFPGCTFVGRSTGVFLGVLAALLTSQAIDARDAAGFGIRKLSVLDVDGLHEAPNDPMLRWSPVSGWML
jgi:hypothetical protein